MTLVPCDDTVRLKLEAAHPQLKPYQSRLERLTPLEYLALAEAALLADQSASAWVGITCIRKAREQMLAETVQVVMVKTDG